MAIEVIFNRERGLSVRTKLNAAIREANKVEKKADSQALLDHVNNSNNPHDIHPENIGAEREGVAFELLLQHANSPGNVHGVPSGEAVEWKSSAQGKANIAQANAKAYTDAELSGHIAASDPHVQYQLKSGKGQADGYAGLDGNAKVPESLLPAIAVTEVFPVADIAARDALTVQIGDVAVVADASADPNVEAGAASYIYDGGAWLQLRNPDFPVVSVNGQVGSVSLSASDVNADEAGTAVQVVGTHSAKSGDVHGVPVGESVEWQSSAQAKANGAETSAKSYTDTHASKTGDTHGVPAGQLIEWKSSAQDKANAALTSANAYTDQHEQRQDNPHGVTAAQAGADPAGTAQNVMDNHLSAANPHSQYVTSAEAGGAAPVQSVHGRTGNVTGQTGDYTYDQVGADQSGAAAQALTNANAYTDAGLSEKLGTNAKAADSDKLDGKQLATIESEYQAVANTAEGNAKAHADNREALRNSATLNLDFARGKYLVDDGELIETTNASEILSVVRATSKWVFGPNGKLREVPPNTIARHWRNGVCQGALIEESRTNLLLWSEDFTKPWWGGGSRTTTLEAAEAPDGSLTANLNIPDADSFGSPAKPSFAITPDTKYAFTFYCKAGGITRVRPNIFLNGDGGDEFFVFNLVTETVENENFNGSGYRETYIEKLAGGWFRLGIIFDTSDPDVTVQVGRTLTEDADGVSGIYIWRSKLEKGSMPSSSIKTTDSPVTRAADLNYRDLGSELNPSGFTQVLRFTPNLPMRVSGLLTVGSKASSYDGDKARSGLRITGDTTLSGEVLEDGGVSVYSRNADQLEVVAGVNTIAMAVDPPSGIVRFALNGEVLEKTTSPFTMSELTRLWLDHSGSATNHALHQAGLYPRALTEQELQEMTA